MDYDIDISDFEKNKIKSQKSCEKLFYDPPEMTTESLSQILPARAKFAKIFSIRKSSKELPSVGIMLRKFVDVAFVPLATSTQEVCYLTKLFFGTSLYKRMIKNFVYPKKFEFKNPYIPGSKKYIVNSIAEEYLSEVKRGLPSLTTMPSYIIRSMNNTVFDFSKIFNQTLPTDEMCRRPQVLPHSQDLILEPISRLVFSAVDENLPMFKMFKMSLPPVGDTFKNIIIPIKITTKDIRVATQWINPSFTNLPTPIKRDAKTSSCVGILKFVIGLLEGNQFIENTMKHDLVTKIWQKEHVIFMFYNDTHAFYIDPQEFKEKGLKFNSVFRFLRTSLKTIIGLNNGMLNPLEIDENHFEGDEEAIKAETALDEKLKLGKDFDDTLELAAKQDGNIKFTKNLVGQINRDEKASKGVTETLEESLSDKKENVNELLAKAKANMDQRLTLGHTSLGHLTKVTTKPMKIDAKVFDKPFNDILKVDKISKMVNDIDLDDIDFDELDENEYDEDQTEDQEVEDTSDDNVEDESDEETTQDFIDNEKDEAAKNSKQALINSVRETIEGKVSEKQQKYLETLKDKYKSIKYDENETLEDVLNRANTISIDIKNNGLNLQDKSMQTCVAKDFTRSYIKKTLSHDIVATVKAFSDSNKAHQLMITGFEKKDISDQFNQLERYKFELTDKYGKRHNITFKMPKIDEDGFMFINGNKKLLKKQLILKPVTKLASDDVYVSSDYNKIHMFRNGKNINKNTIGLRDFLTDMVLGGGEGFEKFISITRGDNTSINKDYETTIEYDEFASEFDKITILPGSVKQITFFFSQKSIRDEIKEKGIEYKEQEGFIPYGINYLTRQVLTANVANSSDSIAKAIIETIKNTELDRVGEIKFKMEKALVNVKPDAKKMMTMVEVQSKKVPLIVFMCGMFGYSEVIKRGNIRTVFFRKGMKETDLSPDDIEYIHSDNVNIMKFHNGVLYYDMYPIDIALLMNGLKVLHPQNLNYEDLDNLATFVDYTNNEFKTTNLIRGWVAFRDLFLTPKTVEILEALHLPTDLLELLLYANSLLQNNKYNLMGDMHSWRLRDYEMLNTFLYSSISENYRTYMTKGKSRFGFSIPEDDILNKMNKNFVLVNYDQTSPGNELKEFNSITYKGPQGINTDRAFSMSKRGQTFSCIGTIGISSPDNATVGITKYLTMNPCITNTLGFIDPPETPEDAKKMSAGTLLTTEEAMIPYITSDDPKRIGFTTGQTKHVVPVKNLDIPLVTTGAEFAMPYNVSNGYVYKAKENGKIVKVDEQAGYCVIQYKSGKTERVDFGARYDKNSDFYLQNNLTLAVKEGQLVKENQIITYNKDFFKMYMGKLLYTQGCIGRVAIHEGEVTEDDSSAISWRLSNKLATAIIKRKQVVLGANANIVSIAKIGDHVIYGDPLMLYEDAKDTENDMALFNLLGDTDDSVLDTIARHSASANYSGVIKDIKIYWTIDPDLMGDSTKKLVKQYINKIKGEIKVEEEASGRTSKRRYEIEVSTPNRDRVNGVIVPKQGGVLIEFFIEHESARGPGDKCTLGSSLKTVINYVMDKDTCARRINPKSKFNTIDFIQSTIGVGNRMVTSVFKTGFLSKICFERGKSIADEFLESIK